MKEFKYYGELLKKTNGYKKRTTENGDFFAAVPLEIFDYDLNLTETRVYMYLLQASSEKGYCWPRQSLIAEKTDRTRSTVSRALRSLERKGLLAIHTIRKENNMEHNVYLPKLGIFFSTNMTKKSSEPSVDDTRAEQESSGSIPKTAQYKYYLKGLSKIINNNGINNEFTKSTGNTTFNTTNKFIEFYNIEYQKHLGSEHYVDNKLIQKVNKLEPDKIKFIQDNIAEWFRFIKYTDNQFIQNSNKSLHVLLEPSVYMLFYQYANRPGKPKSVWELD